MNIVISGGRLQVYGEDVQTYKQIPVGSYEVCFHKMVGFYMTTRPDLTAHEDKIYGNHEYKVNKVMNAYQLFNRNLGVILSGQKGAGKSLLARMLAARAIAENLPVITVSTYYPGIADFLASIEQEVVVIFDEFEKTFGKHDDFDPQEEMLSLFDGMDNGKKMFIITCNEISKLNSYLLNRPGRFHYHFVIDSPTDNEVREYMTDKLLPQYHQYIDRIVGFASTVNITYDYLRAIAFELNMGYSIEETLNDLNIIRTKDISFDVVIRFNNGQVHTIYNKTIDLYANERVYVRAYGTRANPGALFDFVPTDAKVVNNKLMIPKEKVGWSLDEDDFWHLEGDERKIAIETAKNKEIESVVLEKSADNMVTRYVV